VCGTGLTTLVAAASATYAAAAAVSDPVSFCGPQITQTMPSPVEQFDDPAASPPRLPPTRPPLPQTQLFNTCCFDRTRNPQVLNSCEDLGAAIVAPT
jgi:hypothetical protein